MRPPFDALDKGAKRIARGPDGSELEPATMTYYDWLKTQPPTFQDDAIGPKRAQLLRAGGLSAKRFSELNLGRNFKPLTLDEMKRLEPGAFAGAFDKTKDLQTGRYFIILDKGGKAATVKPERAIDVLPAAKGTNPDFVKSSLTSINCQRAVPAYELRRRGFDVEATSVTGKDDPMARGLNAFEMWDLPEEQREVFKAAFRGKGIHGLKELEETLLYFDEGARFEILGRWKDYKGGHVFSAERVGDKIVFIDPQNELENARNFANDMKKGSIAFFRTDTANFKNGYDLSKVVKRAK